MASAPPPADGKPPPAPKKWIPFSAKDSQRIEAVFQKLPDDDEIGEPRRSSVKDELDVPKSGGQPSRSLDEANDGQATIKVPVNEDYLFDVDIENRELGPAYWLGPIYSVCRGSWFYVEGSVLRPCDENLGLQLEEGYIKTKPWTLPTEQPRSSSRSRPLSGSFGFSNASASSETAPGNPLGSVQQLQEKELEKAPVPQQNPALTHRLFGSHLNSFVTYQDANTGYIVTDDFLSRMSGTMYQRFAGGAHFSGTKVVRGFTDLAAKKVKEAKQAGAAADEAIGADSRRSSKTIVASEEKIVDEQANTPQETDVESRPQSRLHTLERQMSSLITSAYENPASQDEQARQREEDEIRDDYNNTPGDDQDREIEHIVLITHGIGQRLGARFETFNFIHDVNEMRKTFKAVYSASPDLQALNSEAEKPQKNMRLQVLPVTWRHLLDFPRQSLKYNRKEHDLSDADIDQDNEYPNLGDITVEGVPALRNIVADLALDILLYQTPAYKDHISRVVVQECNRIYKLFKERNPSFKGKVSLAGHSLGSAILFDILSEQENDKSAVAKSRSGVKDAGLKLDFSVEDLFCFGSPIGLFQMLKGKTIAGRENSEKMTLDSYRESINNPLEDSTSPRKPSSSEAIVSSPKCRQLYNIFHPSDPIAYRLEPLISPAMSSLKPQPLPYTKKTIFGTSTLSVTSTITGIPARVGQSFTGFLSSFGNGLATSFINKSLGISAEDAAKLHAPAVTSQQARLLQQQQQQQQQNVALPDQDRKRKLALEGDPLEPSPGEHHLPTLIDAELETLFSGFQKRRRSDEGQGEHGASADDAPPQWNKEADEKGRRLRHEEAKVRALNENGRVDYSIQEYVFLGFPSFLPYLPPPPPPFFFPPRLRFFYDTLFSLLPVANCFCLSTSLRGTFDISFLAAIASHLAYWTDEDVSHFVISQLLSRRRSVQKSKSMSSLQ